MVLVDNYLPLTSLTFHIAVVCACTLDNDLCVSCFAEVVTGGRCGSASCVAHFASSDDLSQHVKVSRLLQCQHHHVSHFYILYMYMYTMYV